MKNTVLYFGNIFKGKNAYPTPVGSISPLLQERYKVVAASHKSSKVFRLLHMLATLIKYRKEAGLVIIDTYSSQAFWFTVAISYISRLFGIPYITALHGGNLPTRLDSNPGVCKRVFGNAVIVLSPSLYLKVEFEKRGYTVLYIPNNIPLTAYQYKERKALKPNILMVRAFHKVYNMPMAIEVFREVLKVHPDARLCIVGPDKDGSKAVVEELVNKYELRDRVSMPGLLTKPEWHKLSEEYDIFMNTTDFDNMPVSVIEAMLLGLTVVTTNAGGLPYLVRTMENGLVVRTKDAEGMAKAVNYLLAKPQVAHRLSLSARRQAEGYDWEQVKHKWFAMIDTVLSGKNVSYLMEESKIEFSEIFDENNARASSLA